MSFMSRELARDVGFVCLVEPAVWFAKFKNAKIPFGISYLIFQLEHCAATGASCVRGYAQCKFKKDMACWRKKLQLGDASVLIGRPGAASKMAESCMVDGFDVDGKFWTVVEPYVVKGRIWISQLEHICMDIEDGVPLTTIASRYPKQWKYYCRGFRAYERITRGSERQTDWQCGNQSGMAEIVHTALLHRQHANRKKREVEEDDEFIKSTLQ